jgi:hypothetical protein
MSLIDDLLATATQREQPLAPSVDELTVQAPPRPAPGPTIQVRPPIDPGQLAPPLQVPDFQPQGVSQDPQGSPYNYNNSDASQALNAGVNADQPRGGMANPGVYGLLPPSLQHGTLRNVLGALGDAFLVGSGRQPAYEERMQRQEVGNAMAGMNPEDPASVAAAAQRVAATGAAGSDQVADQMIKNSNDAALRRATLEQNNWYRQNVIQDRQNYHADQSLQRMTPYIGGMVAGAHDLPSYTSAYNRAEAIAQRIGPDYHASDFGLVDPKDWTPGSTSTVGMTGNNVQTSSDRQRGQNITQSDNAATNAARIRAAQIAAGGHVAAAQIGANRPSEAGFMNDYIQRVQQGGQTSPEEDQRFLHDTQVGQHARHFTPHAGTGGPAAGGAGPPVLTPQQAARAPKGTVFRTTDGRTLVR